MSTQMLETFKPVSDFALIDLEQQDPSCFNGMVRVKRYRITIKEIPEDREMIVARLQNLWDISDNRHDHEPLIHAAKIRDYEYKGDRGRGLK